MIRMNVNNRENGQGVRTASISNWKTGASIKRSAGGSYVLELNQFKYAKDRSTPYLWSARINPVNAWTWNVTEYEKTTESLFSEMATIKLNSTNQSLWTITATTNKSEFDLRPIRVLAPSGTKS